MKRISNTLHPLVSALLILMVAMVSFIAIGPVIGAFIGMAVFDGNIMDMTEQLANPLLYPEIKSVLMIMQGSATGIGLVLIPWIYMKLLAKTPYGVIFPNSHRLLQGVLISAGIVVSFMVVNSVFIEWNAGLSMPDSWKEVELWMREKEEMAKQITEFLTTFNSPGEFYIAILVVAVLPAIGEELVFRGMLQTEFRAAFGNPHAAIWFSAFLFSAIHMQFFGFVPRLLLGALFGYLFYWSGNLIYPIIAHFIQNGGQLFILYMVQKGVWEIDLDSPESFSVYIILIFVVLTSLLLYYFRQIYRSHERLEGHL